MFPYIIFSVVVLCLYLFNLFICTGLILIVAYYVYITPNETDDYHDEFSQWMTLYSVFCLIAGLYFGFSYDFKWICFDSHHLFGCFDFTAFLWHKTAVQYSLYQQMKSDERNPNELTSYFAANITQRFTKVKCTPIRV